MPLNVTAGESPTISVAAESACVHVASTPPKIDTPSTILTASAYEPACATTDAIGLCAAALLIAAPIVLSGASLVPAAPSSPVGATKIIEPRPASLPELDPSGGGWRLPPDEQPRALPTSATAVKTAKRIARSISECPTGRAVDNLPTEAVFPCLRSTLAF